MIERLQTPQAARVWCAEQRAAGRTLGFVATMGCLHEGHLNLVRAARASNDVVVVSVFVNPLQFGPSEDYSSYPRSRRQDLDLLSEEGIDGVYLPDEKALYPEGFTTLVSVKGLGDSLEGENRPGHFAGVATVVLKLIHSVEPDLLVLGQKDAQQALIIRTMVLDLNWPLQIEVCPTVREADGVA